MSILSAFGVSPNLNEAAAAEKKLQADIDNKTSNEGFPKFKLGDNNDTKVMSIAPGCGTFEEFAGVYAQDGQYQEFVTEQATKQLEALGLTLDAVPDWAKIPAHFAAQRSHSCLFVGKSKVKNSGLIDYADFPASKLRDLGPDHPRNQALQIPGKFGLPNVRNVIYLYCIEHPLDSDNNLDNVKLAKNIKEGNFLRLLELNGGSYAALKQAAAAAKMTGKRFITDYHLVVQWGERKKYSFTMNGVEPVWHRQDLLKLVLQEVHRCGRPIEHADVKKLSDEDFAELVAAVRGGGEEQLGK